MDKGNPEQIRAMQVHDAVDRAIESINSEIAADGDFRGELLLIQGLTVRLLALSVERHGKKMEEEIGRFCAEISDPIWWR
jgi:hypothetical protein